MAGTTEPQLSNKDYTIGWICAISTEYVAARAFLDKEHERPEYVVDNDNNDYTLGEIGRHNVVMAVLPDGEYGTATAASVARDMLHSFPNVRIGLMVGIGGGAPNVNHDIRLGDIVVSTPKNGTGGVFQYNYGKTIQEQSFQMTRFLDQPPTLLRTAVSGLKAQYESDGHQLQEAISLILEKKTRLRKKYSRPDTSTDRLYRAEVVHGEGECCKHPIDIDIDISKLEQRVTRTEDEDNPTIHYGIVASADQLVKNALIRNLLSREKDVLCFEMEAAGLMNHFPCLIIRGICDYSDTHKNKEWQGYAAMTAAAYATDLLRRIPPNKVEAEKKISDRIELIITALSGTEAGINTLKSKLDGNDDLEILDWITPVDYGPQQSDFLSRREPGTGQWLLDSEKYQYWLNGSKQTLFCPGIPGAGKTILTSIVINHLLNKFRTETAIGIAYIYFNFQRKDEQSISGLFASILKQLTQGHSSLPKNVRKLYDMHKTQRTRPPLNDILVVLQSVMTMKSQTIIILDALDECQISDGCRSKFLSKIFTLQKMTKANIYATSRPIPDIAAQFQGSIRQEILATNEDVGRYLEGHMLTLPAFVQRKPDLQQEIKTGISTSVDGMFLLAQLYLDSLQDKTSPREVKDALADLQKRNHALATDDEKLKVLSGAYEGALERIEGQRLGFRSLAKQVLSWVTCAKRPLRYLELQHALAVKSIHYELDKENVREVEDLVSACAGLVTVDNESGIIRLVHYTTQEYFNRTLNYWFPEAQFEITKICTTYLSFHDFNSGPCQTYFTFQNRLRSHPLYDYAACYWGHHGCDASNLSNIVSFLNKQAHVDASSQAFKKWPSGLPYTQAKQITGLHLTAYFGLTKAAEMLLDNQNVNAKDTYGKTPLLWAVKSGHKLMVRFLVDNGAEIEIKDRPYGRTPLSWAATLGHKAITQLLIEKGANTETKDSYNQTPLLWAVENGHMDIVQLLVEKGVEVEPKDSGSRTPLFCSAKKGHMDITQLLVERGANIEIEDMHGRTPLSWATENGHKDIMQLLIHRGANAETKDSYGRTPLLWAAEKGQMDIVQLLVEKGAEVETRDSRHGQTPLSWGANNGYIDIVRLLVEVGANVNVEDIDGRTPLWQAARNRHHDIVQLLVEKGAEVEIKDTRYGRMPLLWAARNGHRDMVQFLLGKGADVEIKDMYGQTPLLWAVENGFKDVVQLLIEKGANVETKDTEGRTSLSCATEKGHTSIIQLLVEKGANVETKDTHYGATTLLWGARNGHIGIVQLLVENGANVKAKDRDGRTPLLWAAGNGHRDIVQLLLEKGAHIETKDIDGRTPLSCAVEKGHKGIVQLLIGKGAEVDTKDSYDQVPLSWAAENGHEDIAQLLVEKGANVMAKDMDGRTPLLYAVEKGHKDVVQLLVENGASVETKDTYHGGTPLWWTARNGHEDMMHLLVEKGANVDTKDMDGRTPVWWAARNGHNHIVQLLIEKDANIETEDIDGRTPQSYALEKGHGNIVQLLVEKRVAGGTSQERTRDGSQDLTLSTNECNTF